jgi:hypothetical protein
MPSTSSVHVVYSLFLFFRFFGGDQCAQGLHWFMFPGENRGVTCGAGIIISFKPHYTLKLVILRTL